MIPAAVAKLNMYIGDPVYDRISEEFEAAQEEGLQSVELDVRNLEPEIRMDFVRALFAIGYEVEYNEDEDTLEIVYE